MEPGVFLAALLIFVGIPAFTVIKVVRLRAARTESPSADVITRLEALERNVQDLQRELGETQERLDFTERLLSKAREEGQRGGLMKSFLIPAVCVATALGATSPCASQRQPLSLFNGKDLTGWHADVPAADSNARLGSPFVVRNGLLVSLGEPRGHLITDSSYRDYRLEVEYRFPAKPGNAGVLVHASTPRALYGMFPRSIEVQMEHGNAGDFWCIVEDIRVPDMERRRGPSAQWGATEGKRRRILNLTDDSEKPVGEWNTMVIEAVGRSIRVWVNGDLVNDGSDATADHGRIALQSEGSEVEFRKLSLTPISKLTTAR